MEPYGSHATVPTRFGMTGPDPGAYTNCLYLLTFADVCGSIGHRGCLNGAIVLQGTGAAGVVRLSKTLRLLRFVRLMRMFRLLRGPLSR